MRRIAIALLSLAGCIDELHGSNVQFDFSPAMPAQASAYVPQTATELPANAHYTLYAFLETMNAAGETVGHLFEVQRFEIHRIVDLASPCFIDVGEHVPFPGLHVSQYAAMMKIKTGIDDVANPPAGVREDDKIDVATAIQRQRNVAALASDAGPKVVSSASDQVYPAVVANCGDATGLPPPMCTDDPSNARRAQLCQQAWHTAPNYYEGTDRVLTAPLDGATYGFVDGINPVNLAPVGGAAFFVDESLADFDGFAVYWQYDDADGNGQPDYPPSVPPSQRTALGELMLFGKPEHPTRGVMHVHMTSFVSPLFSAELAIFANIDEDDVHF